MELEHLKKEFVDKLKKDGEPKFYQFLLFTAINKIVEQQKEDLDVEFINLDYLAFHDKFLILYRREGDANYLRLANIFRKAGNKIYRFMLKQDLCDKNTKFLNVV